MPRKPKYRKPYPPEFRREAVALYARTDRTLGEIAADLGVSRESLRLWVQQAQIERGERDGLSGDEHEELRELPATIAAADTSAPTAGPQAPPIRPPGSDARADSRSR